MRILFFILYCSIFLNGFSQEEKSYEKKPLTKSYQINDELEYVYPRPKFFNFITGIPKNYKTLGQEFVKKENLKWLGLTLASTGILIAGDEILLDEFGGLQNVILVKVLICVEKYAVSEQLYALIFGLQSNELRNLTNQ